MLPRTIETTDDQPARIVLTEHDRIAANSLIKIYGDDASIKAAIRADAMAAHGDEEGYALWKRIAQAIIEATRTMPLGQPGDRAPG